MHTDLPGDIQTLYSDLLSLLRTKELERCFGQLSGGFAKKQVSGKTFWYFKTTEGLRGQKEFYVGPDTEQTRQVMASYAQEREGAEREEASIARMASMLRSSGVIVADAPSARVLKGLAAAGVFRLGGVLVGTHAYLALGNLLGVRWSSELRKQDIDLAALRRLEVAVPQEGTDIPKALEALQMGFLPVPGFHPSNPGTAFKVRGQALRVDLLTPARNRQNAPVPIPRFAAAAAPLPFLDYILENAVEAAVLNAGATLVRVPDPARFALHKLAVAGERPVADQAKAAKDRTQASEVLGALAANRPGDISLALEALRARKDGLLRRVARSAKKAEGLPQGLLRRIEGSLPH